MGPADRAEGGRRLVLDKDDSVAPNNATLSPVVKRLISSTLHRCRASV